jgi:hypothetical protein
MNAMTERLPDYIMMKTVTYGDGPNGMAVQVSKDATNSGVICEARRKDGRSAFKEIWRYRWLPGQNFTSYTELRVAVNALKEEDIQQERERWPQRSGTTAGTRNQCWADGLPGTDFVTVQTSWCEYEGAPLCAGCTALAVTDPGIVVRAVAKRQAAVVRSQQRKEKT